MAGPLQFLIESTPLYAVAVTVATVGLLLWASQHARRWGLLWVLAVLPVVLIYVYGADNRTYSFHGFQHQAIAYQIIEGVLPPVNPLLAGEPLLYTWMPHLIVGKLSALVSIPPASGFAFASVLALVATIVFLFKAARAAGAEPQAAVFGVVIAMFGTYFESIIRWLTPGVPLNFQALPPVMKYTNLNPMPFGIMCFAAFLFSLTRILTGPEDSRVGYLWLFASVLGAALLYPIHWLGIVASGAVAILLLLTLGDRALRPRLFRAAASAGIACLIALPYLLTITRSDADQGVLHLADMQHITAWSLSFVAPLIPMIVILAIGHRKLRLAASERRPFVIALGAIVLVNAVLCVFVAGQDEIISIEYKYRTLSFIPIGLAAGIAIQGRGRRELAFAAAVLGLMLYPFPFTEMYKMDPRPIRDPYYTEGSSLRHADSESDELYRWIERETHPRAAFVDSYLTIPAFARRSLFVGLDWRRRGDTQFVWDGWHYPVEDRLQKILGGNPKVIRNRIFAARHVLEGRELDVVARIFDDELRRTDLDGIYVVVREGVVRSTLDDSPGFTKVFENRSAAVFRFESPDAG